MSRRQPMKNTLQRPLRAAIAFLGHLFLGSLVLIGIWLTEMLFELLWHGHEPTFFGWLPVRWIFDGSDLAVMLVFGFWGIVEANDQMRR
jgi:hypothetical protein